MVTLFSLQYSRFLKLNISCSILLRFQHLWLPLLFSFTQSNSTSACKILCLLVLRYFIGSMIDVIDLIQTRVPALANNTEAANIFDDIRMVLNGVRSLKTLRNSLKLDIPLRSVSWLCPS